MLSDVPAEDLLGAVADGLESVVLPALAGPAERRQCRAAIYLTRAVAQALPRLDAAVDADIADVAAELALPIEPAPEPYVVRRAHRDDLVRRLSRALQTTIGTGVDSDRADSDKADSYRAESDRAESGLDGIDRELLLAVARRSVDRWLQVFPPDESLGAFVELDQTPAGPPPG